MLFNSSKFLIFFPIVVLCYYLLPQKIRYIWIMISSYYFYMCWNRKYGILLAGITLLTYVVALIIEKVKKNQKYLLSFAVISCLCALGIFKYLYFIISNANFLMKILHFDYRITAVSFIVPVGMSFYIFQAIGYLVDVYHGRVKAERNPLRYAAFISFFPQLVAGPIERAEALLPQFYEEHKFDYEKIKNSLLLMMWGMFMKIVIADRAAIFVNRVYDSYMDFDGYLIVIATVLFAFQIYCDFAGYSIIAMGAAGVMGFDLMENFKSPYCALSVKDFWARWHISLTNWFRDYVYIPLGGNRCGKLKKYINTLIVFSLSGLWHGANWSFVVWGIMNGLFIVIEDIGKKNREEIKFVRKNKLYIWTMKFIRGICTFILVDITWVFFRSQGIKDVYQMTKHMLQVHNINVLFDKTIHFYIMERKTFHFLILSILVLMVVDCCHNKGIHFRTILGRQNIVIRWTSYLALLMVILIFGVWGPSFNASAFIYFQF